MSKYCVVNPKWDKVKYGDKRNLRFEVEPFTETEFRFSVQNGDAAAAILIPIEEMPELLDSLYALCEQEQQKARK